MPRRPVLSINRGFQRAGGDQRRYLRPNDLLFLAAHDDDPFCRYEAMQSCSPATSWPRRWPAASAPRWRQPCAIGEALARFWPTPALDDAMRGELMILPTHAYLSELLEPSDPGTLFAAREGLKAWIGAAARQRSGRRARPAPARSPSPMTPQAKGARKVKTQALIYLAAGAPQEAATPRRRAIRHRLQHDRPPRRADGAVRPRHARTRRQAGRFPCPLRRQCAGDRQVVQPSGRHRCTPTFWRRPRRWPATRISPCTTPTASARCSWRWRPTPAPSTIPAARGTG